MVSSGRNVNGRNVKAPFYPILRIFGWSIQRHDLSKMLELENEHKIKDEPKKENEQQSWKSVKCQQHCAAVWYRTLPYSAHTICP